ncbi:MAG: hypothetical protein ACF8TS_22570, partial [Maioricimonas sp. JB049]
MTWKFGVLKEEPGGSSFFAADCQLREKTGYSGREFQRGGMSRPKGKECAMRTVSISVSAVAMAVLAADILGGIHTPL